MCLWWQEHSTGCNLTADCVFEKIRNHLAIQPFTARSRDVLNTRHCVLKWLRWNFAPVTLQNNRSLIKQWFTCVPISVTKWCIVGYSSDILWDLWEWSSGIGACSVISCIAVIIAWISGGLWQLFPSQWMPWTKSWHHFKSIAPEAGIKGRGK